MYNNTVKLRDQEVKFRKWKVKDRTKFKQALKDGLPGHVIDEALVYDCLEDPSITLTPEEFKYVMIQIRKESIGDSLQYELACQSCSKIYEVDVKLDDLFQPSYSDFGKLKHGDISIEMGRVQNKNFYREEVAKFTDNDERSLFDFLMHIKKINGSDSFTFESLFEYINNMDLDAAASIFDQWEAMKFNLNETKKVNCPYCKNHTLIKFDFMPDFVPSNWRT
jgi:hypothetical protein